MNKYDLKERTTNFGKDVINFAKIIPQNVVTRPIISQFVRSGTSSAVNYCEADNAESKMILNTKLAFVKRKQKKLNIG